MTSNKIQRLLVKPNEYEWGKVGNDSMAARLTKNASEQGFEIKSDQTYAELWMGTHPTNPAYLFSSPKTLLSKHIQSDPSLLGSAAEKFKTPFDGAKGSGTEDQIEGHVPFLFKVLCCKQALPLQIHPNKELARKLHEKEPDKFPDTNHKPEIAVCLSPTFLGFAAFRPYHQIVSFLATVPEISQLSPRLQDDIKTFTSSPSGETLQKVWEGFLHLGDDEKVVKRFTERVKKDGKKAFEGLEKGIDEEEKGRLVKATESAGKYYPGDGGLFSSLFFLNLVELKKGEGMYVGADGPHAWLEGDIVELMAISDNVLNVGFMPSEEKDTVSLVAQTVTCTPKSIPEIKLDSQPFSSKSSTGKTTVYSTPFEEFSILRIQGDDTLKALDGPAVAIVLEGDWSAGDVQAGEGSKVEGGEGTVLFVGAGTETKWSVKDKGEVWMAFYDGDAGKDEVGEK
ncbi:mannose-6-phosphate isomerase, class I [Kwoniella newhampshirensis]|uniref:Mannose-6-phosphate isomerase n=1 Tax=Kwoniella newhampshirensis TaxID=1651941 RepID=A0AAW0YVH6_9TREE